MNASANVFPKDAVVTSYDWNSIKKDSLVVDVGGGIGSATIPLAKTFPHLRYVVQDRASVVPEGLKNLQIAVPDALASGRVKFEAHNFFDPQAIKNASIFMMRFVLHDWPLDDCRKILSLLRASAAPYTKLLLLEMVVPYATKSTGEFAHIPGGEIPDAPAPLLPNLGFVAGPIYMVDMQMLNAGNSQERTVKQWVEVAEGTGWKLEAIKRGPMCGLSFAPV